jgi:hypothetical protein
VGVLHLVAASICSTVHGGGKRRVLCSGMI